jgi:cytochrome b involved in lipid metabolism
MQKFVNHYIRLFIIFFLITVTFVNLTDTYLTQSKTSKLQNTTPSTQKLSTKLDHNLSTFTSEASSQKISATPTQVLQQVDLFAEISVHNKSFDCWISYDGHIYDITSYFGSHPGGDAYLAKYCGSDATNAFNSKDSTPPIPHSQAAHTILSQFLIQ